MSPSSTGDSPHSAGAASSSGRSFPMPARDTFNIEMPSPQLQAVANGTAIKTPTEIKPSRAAGFNRDGILGSAAQQKARQEQPPNGLSSIVGDETLNPLKRRNTEASVDYPRRRATIACEVCRSRKSRCDGTKPKCKLCTELGAECIYREPGIKLDAGDKLILERLNRIESLIQMNMMGGQNSHAGMHLGNDSPPISNGTGLSSDNLMGQISSTGAFSHVIPGGNAVAAVSSWTSPGGNSLSTMPKVHTNAALHLLQWPLIRDLVARPYDPQIILQLEMAREPLHSLAKTPCVDLSNTNAYIEAYFERVNIWYACVNPYSWRSHYRIALSTGFREGAESCIVLLVLALGQASLRGSISNIVPTEDPPGLQYFTAAWSLLPGMMTANTVLAAQCHLLAAAYLFYLVRPLEAWNLLCSVSSKLQLLLMTPSRIPEDQRELIERIYWNTLLSESELLAELDLPHTGIVQFEDSVGLPGGFQGEESEAVGRDDLWYFLAEIALRRLLNRVSNLIYSKDSIASTTSLEPVVSELDFQLTQWYESLPSALQFSFTRAPLPDPMQTVLRLRFFACRTVIYRPYILMVLDNEQAILDPTVRDNCHKCLEAAIRQLEHMPAHHAGHMPYLWQGALSIVSQTLLLMGASMSPSLSNILANLVAHREVIDRIISDVILDMERLSVLAPSISMAAEIIKEAEARRRNFLNG